jgi:hypothetical protein
MRGGITEHEGLKSSFMWGLTGIAKPSAYGGSPAHNRTEVTCGLRSQLRWRTSKLCPGAGVWIQSPSSVKVNKSGRI